MTTQILEEERLPLVARSRNELNSLLSEKKWFCPTLASRDYIDENQTVSKEFLAFEFWKDFLKYSLDNASDTAYYEILDENEHSTMYFDVEWYQTDDDDALYDSTYDVLHDITTCFEKFCDKKLGENTLGHFWFVLDASSEKKKRFRLIYRGYFYLKNYKQRKHLFLEFIFYCRNRRAPFLAMPSQTENEPMCALDLSVYSKYQELMCIGSSKHGTNCVLKPVRIGGNGVLEVIEKMEMYEERFYFPSFLTGHEIELDLSLYLPPIRSKPYSKK